MLSRDTSRSPSKSDKTGSRYLGKRKGGKHKRDFEEEEKEDE